MQKEINYSSGDNMNSNQPNPLVRILYIEGKKQEAEPFIVCLKNSSLKCEISWFDTAELALDKILSNSEEFDIVVCDYLLPGMTGLELFEKLSSTISIPFIILTGAGIESFAIKALKSGVDDYLVKDTMNTYLKMLPNVISQVIKNFNVRINHVRSEKELFPTEQRLNSIINTDSDAMISIDSNNKIVMWNRAAEDIFGYSAEDSIGKDVSLIIPNIFSQVLFTDGEQLKGKDKIIMQGKTIEIEGIRNGGNRFPLELSWAKWNTEEGEFITAIIRDTTARKESESERDELIDELQDAISNIKVLKGLIPICSNCKKIRDDEGCYHQIEEYIVKYSEAQFSHGFCQECAENLYPELFDGEDKD